MSAGRSRIGLLMLGSVLWASLWLLLPGAMAEADSQAPDCGGARVVVEGGDPSPFVLPDASGQKISIDPSAVLHITAEGIPPGAKLRWGVRGLGTRLSGDEQDISAGDITVNVKDYSSYARGLYDVEVALITAQDEACAVPFQLVVPGFGGTAAVASTAVAGAAGLGALASAPLSANGMNTKLKLKVQLSRRRPTGLRRWLPVPAWKRTIFGVVVGAITGLGAAVLLQQTGYSPLSIATGVKGMVVGGGLTFGVGYSLGVLRTYLKPPLPKPGGEAPAGPRDA